MSLIRRSATLLTGETAARLLGVVLYAVLARVLGVQAFGVISLGMTVSLIVGTIVDFGQSAHASRVVAADGTQARRVVSILFANKVILGVVACVGSVVVLAILGFDRQQLAVVFIMGVWTAVLSIFESERALLRALGMTRHDATANGLESLLRVLVVVGIALAGSTLVGVASGFVVEAVAATIVLSILLVRWVPARPGEVPSDTATPSAAAFLRSSASIGIGAVALALFYRVDQLFVARIAGSAANGLYAAAARIAFTGCVVAQLVVAAAYPELAALHANTVAYGIALRHAVKVAFGASVAVALSIAILATPVVIVLYGRDFSASAGLLRVLSLTVLFNGISAVGLYSAVALRREKRSLLAVFVLTPLVVFGYYLAVSAYGAIGAAWVSVLAEIVLASTLLFISGDHLRAVGTAS